MKNNIIKISNSKIKDDILFINDNPYNYGDFLDIFKTEKEYVKENGPIEQVISHFDGKLAYIEDTCSIFVGGDIDDLSDQISYLDDSNAYNFEEFIEQVSIVSNNPFQISTVCWEEIGIGVYYIDFEKDLKSLRLGSDEWEGTEVFIDLAKDKGYDTESDDFYDNDIVNEDSRTQCMEVCMDIYDMLLSEPELLRND